MLKTAPKFGDNMILQRNKSNVIWGTAPDDEVIEVRFLRRSYVTEAKEGKWEVELDEMDAGGPYTMDIYCKREHLHFQNVMIGEVWLICGKPDITDLPVDKEDSFKEAGVMEQSSIYTYSMQEENSNMAGGWELYSETCAGKKNAFLYYFTRSLYRELRVPIGIIICNNGKCSMMHEVSEKIAPYGLRGVVFYQYLEDLCETFSDERIDYAMLRQWRELFMNKTLDIYLMQMPTHFISDGDNWCMLKQMPSVESSKEGLTVIMDCNEYDKKKYLDKSDSAIRIAKHVLGKTYGRSADNHPSYKGKIQIKGEEMEYIFAG